MAWDDMLVKVSQRYSYKITETINCNAWNRILRWFHDIAKWICSGLTFYWWGDLFWLKLCGIISIIHVLINIDFRFQIFSVDFNLFWRFASHKCSVQWTILERWESAMLLFWMSWIVIEAFVEFQTILTWHQSSHNKRLFDFLERFTVYFSNKFWVS